MRKSHMEAVKLRNPPKVADKNEVKRVVKFATITEPAKPKAAAVKPLDSDL